MPLQKMIVKPGVNTQYSKTLNEDGWSASQLIRFKNGLPQKMGGWQKLLTTALTGTATGMHSWADLDGNAYLAVGTEQALQVVQQGELLTITPVDNTVNIACDFDTTNGSTTVTVGDTSHGQVAGNWIDIVIPVSVGGVVLFGLYQIASVVDANTYTVVAASAATSSVTAGGAVPQFNTTNTSTSVTVTLNNHGYTTADTFTVQVSTVVGGITFNGDYAINSITNANQFVITGGTAASSTTSGYENGGNCRIDYLLPTGYASNTPVGGFGIGGYGSGTYGAASGSTVIMPLRQWFLDNWGENLIGNPTNGTLYEWVPLSGNPATAVSGAPSIMTASFVSMPEQIVIALGAEVGGAQDPNLIRWCSAGDNTDWIASSTNQAGSYRIPTGSRIVGGRLIEQGALIWTDVDVWLMQYTGLPFVFSFTKLGAGNNELMAERAHGSLGQATYFVSDANICQVVGGSIQVMQCDVWDKMFRNLNTNQLGKVHLATNELFREITVWYPSAESDVVDSYIKYNQVENTWDYGTQNGYDASIARTAWVDVSPMGKPIGADVNGYLQQHEIGNNADGLPMLESITSGYFDLDINGQGTHYVYVDRLLPDFVWGSDTDSLNLYVYATNYSGEEPTIYGPFLVTPTTKYVILRIRGRQIAIQISGVGVNTFWRLGANRYQHAPAGRR